ncbi:MAG: methyltransferase domain-containing protein [Candidatus Ruthia sp.]|jgi:2-polyprenyl-3-methyl-5-hydroxy-6-metoxy-1,4-benzoquinol methylase|nr:methyltransferase domain-containing protein [Candidatus Ruthturnera sp.]MBT6922763.1 methyltransferase domain-containing protein [Candidatus Ruthturnera sp.]
MTDTLSHWDKVYQSKDHTQVSWHQNHATLSFDWILAYTDKNANIIDVGSGVSILADNLLDEGYTHLSLLELSLTAIQATKERLKSYSNRVNFYNENILDFETDTQYDLWHDRAVFHFLTDEKDQQTYLNKLNQYLKPQGYFLLATFAPTGPKQCSGLDIVQYDKDKIVPLLGDSFTLIKTTSETHPHPNGSTQDFNYFLFQKL